MWTAPVTIATVLSCIGVQVALVAAGRPGGPLATGARRRLLVSIPLAGVFLWVFIAVSLSLCIAQAAQDDYSFRHVARIVGVAIGVAAAVTLALSAAVFVLAPKRLLQRVGARPPEGEELERLESAWALLRTDRRPRVLMVDTGGAECFTVGGLSPAIVVSSALFARLEPRERAAILSHEWGHVTNGDALANTVGETAERVIFFDPLLKVIGPVLRRQSEYAADAASSLFGLGPDLASALKRISTADPDRAAGSGGIVGQERGWRAAHPPLERRLARLTRPGRARIP